MFATSYLEVALVRTITVVGNATFAKTAFTIIHPAHVSNQANTIIFSLAFKYR